MKRVVELGAALLLVGFGCGEPPEDTAPESVSPEEEQEPVRPQVVPIESIPMPELPEPRRRFLVATSAGSQDLSGEWEARAAICDDLGVLQVLADTPGFGTLLLFQMLGAGERVGVYPISHAETGAPEPPASQIGVQLFRDGDAFAYQGDEGEVELTAVDERVTGRFAVTLREITTDERVRFTGIFDRVPVESLPQEQCGAIERALFAADTTDQEPN